ncbi:MAG: ABC transporter ATP-binding protein, partial [Bacilli bacterium]|nr:ABC transporter ATP-binding protein [Bacilli bacterium]
LTVYNRPANLFVADFVGNPTMNFLKAKVENVDGKKISMELLGHKVTFEAESEFELGGEDVVVGIRPEFLPITKGGAFKGLAYSTLPAGMETTVKIKVGEIILSSVVFGSIDYATDEEIEFDVKGKGIILFDALTGKNIALGSIKKN